MRVQARDVPRFQRREAPMKSEPEAQGRVLVADDDDAVGRFTAAVLRSAGFEVDVVGTGFEATEALTLHSYDACVADIKMPGNEHLELVDGRPNGVMVPLVLITGEPSLDTAVTAFRRGVLDYIVKPFTSEELLSRVVAVVKKGREIRAAARTSATIAALVDAATHVVDAVGRTSFDSVSRASSPRASREPAAGEGPELPADLVSLLSPRQHEVVRLLAVGHPIPEVAALLDLSVHTVRGHMKAIFSKLGVQSQVALLSRLAGHGIPKVSRR
jgi:DNA-binding NarL/FixJ family response regulator